MLIVSSPITVLVIGCLLRPCLFSDSLDLRLPTLFLEFWRLNPSCRIKILNVNWYYEVLLSLIVSLYC
jgi:hypothetical protein